MSKEFAASSGDGHDRLFSGIPGRLQREGPRGAGEEDAERGPAAHVRAGWTAAALDGRLVR